MRQDMEIIALGKESPVVDLQQPRQINQKSKNEFEEDLKRQLLDLKQKNRDLQSKIDEYILKQKVPDGNLTDNTILNSHMKSLNETISRILNQIF